ncbi:MAG: fumarylacetoacetate hydrolase family protein [Fluviicoccus sp.]|uniref:fumarylacetoacetate hydrolase family protein n=1 Tax=Fluviicoccus sp. TaxID=2003552 RepID=UPI002728359D|nr:fumarylacetoacetate hydrolase family protein [Fluviicoccus sp.]MDO8330623.1 fumarylacetoacetate hydrolase family protein [Fluviicoccus sp.]
MSLSLVRFTRSNASPSWGLLQGGEIRPLSIPCTTTAALLAHSHAAIRASVQDSLLPLADNLQLLSPITRDAKVLCQGANYRQHMLDSGVDPDAKRFNMFFTKSSASIHDPVGSIVRPRHVQLLDYEVELTLVLGKATTSAVKVSAANLHEYVAGICIGNDVSARCVQIPQMQFHKGKSYRTFCPLGPVLCLLEPEEMHYLDDLQLSLTVNGEVRQQDSTANLVFKPAETLTEYSQIADFNPGDVIMTGTPSGCALGLPNPTVVRASAMLPDPVRFGLFLKAQLRRPQYLKNGDRVEVRIASRDGRLDLGVQRHTIVPEA